MGVINLNEIVRGPFRSACLGYYAFIPHMGRGYMTEAFRLVPHWAFRDLHLHRVEANIQPGNHLDMPVTPAPDQGASAPEIAGVLRSARGPRRRHCRAPRRAP